MGTALLSSRLALGVNVLCRLATICLSPQLSQTAALRMPTLLNAEIVKAYRPVTCGLSLTNEAFPVIRKSLQSCVSYTLAEGVEWCLCSKRLLGRRRSLLAFG